jgi:hypothetical protein
MRITLMLFAAVALSPSLYARQVPTTPGQVPIGPPQSQHGCLRPDVALAAAQIKSALGESKKSGTNPVDVEPVQKDVAGCTYYKVSLATKMTIEDTELAGVSSTIKGQGSITFGLAPGSGGSDYDFDSGVDDLTAPIYWERGSALITKPDCIVTTVELPHTLFGFWLGVRASGIGVRITPAGDELHDLATRCKDPMGKWHDLPPSKEAILTPAWIRMHGEGRLKGPQTADQKALIKYSNQVGKGNAAPPKVSSPTGGAIDMQKLMAMDPAKLAEMAEKMKSGNPADMAQMKQLMEGIVPNADAHLAAARDNFMFSFPGDCTETVNGKRWVCSIGGRPAKPVTLPDRLGYGTIKRITEETTITIEKLPARP